ncbi:hypothetical protein L107_15342 [Cyanobium sp. Copco_Reservoir_LC18]|uniref:hypothetical protein n=1 Tax=Cyanobium sp. Copco_Reservoir_LC18 TaxID=1328305 RepID=UPI0013591AD9|nr:hypothetical protein [Cyanobium sp. Copco_Reservoir_LC18]KAF0652274.1 hypothetical protein L107_15342 [Cyanobium sp. Copco_Reservoir_LC18]
MTTTSKRSRDAFSFQETARILGISAKKLNGICQFFDAHNDDEWELVEGEFFEYEPGQARSRRFYEEGVMALAKYLEEKEGGSILAKIHESFTQHRARVTRTLVKRRIIQVTQDRSAIQIRGDLVFLEQRSVVRVLGTNGKGMAGTITRIQEESSGLEGAEGLEIGVHFDSFEGNDQRHWSQRGIVRLAKTMRDKGRITKARKAWVKAVADVAEECFEVQRKLLESHEARVKTAKDKVRQRALRKDGAGCAVSGQKPSASDQHPVELEAHHLFDASSRPDLATYEENLIAISSSIHRNFHKWMGSKSCEPKDFVDYLLGNEMNHFDGPPSVKKGRSRSSKSL